MDIPDEFKKKKILIVDDVQTMISVIRGFLEHAGFHNLTTAKNGKEALEKLNNKPFDLILCDWSMPELSGLEVLKEIKSNESLQSTGFVMLTGDSEMDHVKEAVENGIDGYIVKPVSPKVLFENVVSVLEKYK